MDGAVVRKTYAVSKLAGIGNTRLLMGLYRGTATIAPEEPAKTPADDRPVRTAAPAVKPAATPEPAGEEELTFSATATPRPGMTSAPRDDGNPLDRLIDTASGTVAQMEAAATSVPTEFSEAFYLMQAEVRKVTERYLGAGEKTEAEIKSFADQLTLQEVYYLRVEMDALETYAGSIGLTAWEGYRFLGWVDQADGVVLSSETGFVLRSGGDVSVAATFAKEGEGAWFGVSDRTTSSDMTAGYISHVNAPVYLFDDLGKAVDCAVSGGYPCIVLLNGGILPAGSYVIPAEATLLIPFDDECTLYLDSPASTGEQTSPYAYRTLTMAAGAEVTVNGMLSLSAKHQYACIDGCSARPIGSYGHINMAGGSSIRVGSGGKLYAWGYITGGGEVIAEDGAEVYEVFQIMDFRGAVGQSMKNGVYPFSQYYVQNIEVPLEMYAGSTEYALTSTNVSGTVSSSLFRSLAQCLTRRAAIWSKITRKGLTVCVLISMAMRWYPGFAWSWAASSLTRLTLCCL